MLRRIVWTVLAISLMSACGAEVDESDPYRAEVRQARESAVSDFERSALSDGKVTRGEYEEAVARFVDCAKQRGIAISTNDQFGYYTYELVQAPNVDEVLGSCGRGTKSLIEPLYVTRLTNPQRADVNELFAKCLVKNGAAPADYTAERARSDKAASFVGAPFDPEDPKVVQCLANPSF